MFLAVVDAGGGFSNSNLVKIRKHMVLFQSGSSTTGVCASPAQGKGDMSVPFVLLVSGRRFIPFQQWENMD